MKAAVLHKYDPELTSPKYLSLEEVPNVKIEKETDVIVRIGGAGVCRTDLHLIQGLWQRYNPCNLPHVLGHENAGWVEEVGKEVHFVKRGDPVICHPLVTEGYDLAARRGDDMHIDGGSFPGINVNGGYAELLRTTERCLVKLPATLAPKDVAPHADAGLTAYHAVKKASRTLLPDHFAVIIGAGGLGHIAIQVMRALCGAAIIVVDSNPAALALAGKIGADYTVLADEECVPKVLELTHGKGAEAVLDFVAEGNAVDRGLAMTRNAGAYYIIGYGGELKTTTMEMIVTEKSIIGNLVGTYPDLVELMELANRGRVELTTREYKLADADQALHDLNEGKVRGRAVLIP
ncbi:MAG: NAD(P)-dependent alcohol dehydrogenase [Terracidiphilus sp.]